MAYTIQNFKTKRELKEAVAKYMDNCARGNEAKEIANFNGLGIKCYQPGLFGHDLSSFNGKLLLEGPHAPANVMTWYAEAELRDGVVIKVS